MRVHPRNAKIFSLGSQEFSTLISVYQGPGSALDLALDGEAMMQFAKQLNVLGTLLSLGFLAAIVFGML